MDDIAIARALHVVSVVIWIRGMTFMTMIILPAIRRDEFGEDWLKAFHSAERRFVWVARIVALIVGATGFYIVGRLDLWQRFASARFWWMHAMLGLWLVFIVILFVAEPLILSRRFNAWAVANPRKAFAALQRGHIVLVALSLLTIFGAVTGSHGWMPF